jgi:hypothetical protein
MESRRKRSVCRNHLSTFVSFAPFAVEFFLKAGFCGSSLTLGRDGIWTLATPVKFPRQLVED